MDSNDQPSSPVAERLDEPRQSPQGDGGPMTFDSFWAENYAARYAGEQAREASLRDDAFAPTTLTVAGLELRPMTAQDLLLLHGLDNPFIAGGVLTPEAIAQFLAVLVEPAPAGWLRRRRFFRHVAAQPYAATCAALQAYVARMLASAGVSQDPKSQTPDPAAGADSAPPHDLNFLVPLIVEIAAETGWPEADILAMRLDRLFQYRVALDQRAGRKPPLGRAERLKSEALAAYTEYLVSLQPTAPVHRPPSTVL